MNLLATVANSTWMAASFTAWLRLRSAFAHPELAQVNLLRRQLAENCACAYGRVHRFDSITSYAEFSRRVPIVGYDELAPWIDRIVRGEQNVLSCDHVTRLTPTSGTLGARKLIPFTAGLQREFNAAIGPWMVDLAQQYSSILFGPAYWSVTPAIRESNDPAAAIPIGFADDAEYLGGVRHRVIEAAMAAPSVLRHARTIDELRRLALLFLLRNEDLRLISVWHPSFLSLLLDAMPKAWESLLNDIERGGISGDQALPPQLQSVAARLKPLPHRSAQLRRLEPSQLDAIWPMLRVVSCWGDGHAGFAFADLRQRMPHVTMQPKGLLSTEAVVTIPFGEKHPVAVTSHFFEFADDHGTIHQLHELRGATNYEVIVTTRGGLWRYRTGDRVAVTGFLGRTPSLTFVGRNGRVSDLCGEKLSEAFVAQVLQQIIEDATPAPRFAMLAPDERHLGGSPNYTLYVEGHVSDYAADHIEAGLRKNPHYAYCRDLGQLDPLRTFVIERYGYETFSAVELERGARLGDIKPVALSLRTDWAQRFPGVYAPNSGASAESRPDR